jgi:hypothetical protein
MSPDDPVQSGLAQERGLRDVIKHGEWNDLYHAIDKSSANTAGINSANRIVKPFGCPILIGTGGWARRDIGFFNHCRSLRHTFFWQAIGANGTTDSQIRNEGPSVCVQTSRLNLFRAACATVS